MSREERDNGVPITQYALARRISRERAVREALQGLVTAWQDANRRWYVSRADYDRALADSRSEPVAASA